MTLIIATWAWLIPCMGFIYETSVSSEVKLFVCTACCNTLQTRIRAALWWGVFPLWRWWPVFCSGSQETEGRAECMRHFEKQACKISHHQAGRLCFAQSKLSLKYWSLGWLYMTSKSNQRSIQLAADTKGNAAVHYAHGNPLSQRIQPRTWTYWWTCSTFIFYELAWFRSRTWQWVTEFFIIWKWTSFKWIYIVCSMSASLSCSLNSRIAYHTVIKLAGLYSSQFERHKVSFWLSIL